MNSFHVLIILTLVGIANSTPTNNQPGREIDDRAGKISTPREHIFRCVLMINIIKILVYCYSNAIFSHKTNLDKVCRDTSTKTECNFCKTRDCKYPLCAEECAKTCNMCGMYFLLYLMTF